MTEITKHPAHMTRTKPQRSRFLGFTYIETALTLVVSSTLVALAVPSVLGMLHKVRANGDGREASSAIALTKLRAASDFTHARLYADLSAQTLQLQVWDRTNNVWSNEGPSQALESGDKFGYGSLSSPPSSTQASIGQAAACQTAAETISSSVGDISNSACVIFNSRGVPVDYTGTATGNDALYVNDSSSVYAVTVASTGVIHVWRSDIGAASWKAR